MLHSLAHTHTLNYTANDEFSVISQPRENALLYIIKQDEFRQWFRAKVHVMSAPGMKPFDSLDLQSMAQPPNGDQGISAAHKEHHGKFAQRQPAQVHQRKTASYLSSFVARLYSRFRFYYKSLFE